MTTILNAAPMLNYLGVDDDSQQQVTPEPEVVPQHLPLVPLYTKTGPSDLPQLVVGASRGLLYGDDSFDTRKKWANHSTPFSNLFNKNANAQFIMRMKPADAGPNATIRLWADVLPTMVQDYTRNPDGSYATDSTGNKIPTSQKVAGFLLKFVVEQVQPDQAGNDTFGIATQKAGDQTDSSSSTQSIRYPILDARVPFFGEDGNNNGLRIWAPTTLSSTSLDQRLLTDQMVYPFRMATVHRKDAKSSGQIVNTQGGDQFIDVSFKKGAIDKNTNRELYVNKIFFSRKYGYQDKTAQPPVYGQFGEIKVYDNNVHTLLQQFYAAEMLVHDAQFTDFTGETGEEYRFNMIGGTTSNGVPYHSFQIVSGQSNSVRLTETTTLYAAGGSDGTMNDTLFDGLVSDFMDVFADANSWAQNDAKFPFSALWDSGYTMDTKKQLAKFIAVRKDTYVNLATYVAGEAQQPASVDSARAALLRTYLQTFPESEYFGTKTMRGTVQSRSGWLVDESYTECLTMNYDLADKVSLMMGAADGRWNATFKFDENPNNVVTNFRDVSVGFTPVSVRQRDWASGMNWVQDFDRRQLSWPAVQTVYDDDTSVLNGFFTMAACCELEKVAARGHRFLQGNQSLSNDQFAERLDKFTEDNTNGRFAGIFTIVPKTFFTTQDVQRNFSYTQQNTIYAPGMKTVGTTSIVAKRLADAPVTA